MKTILILGAIICFIIGLIFSFYAINGFLSFGSEISQDPRLLLACCSLVAFTFLAFAPTILLTAARKQQTPKRYFIFAGVAEVLVILLFVAMLFPAL